MIATYRLQLTPEFGFGEVREQLAYFRRLGVSHLYLSPITQAALGSTHGYDVTDHNMVRDEFGGREGFEALREAALREGLGLLLDIVPNHAGVGSHNEAWQDLLAYGPQSPNARTFDIDWNPPKEELRGKLLLPFLGRPYGEALDEGEIVLDYDEGCFYARYYDNRFRLSPASYGEILAALLPDLERQPGYFDLLELQGLYADLAMSEREKAEALKGRLGQDLAGVALEPALAHFSGERLHGLLERQYWRLAYWKTAGDEINYRRFFDVNGLVALRMEEQVVFWEAHRLLGELLLEDGVDGVRVDHVDGLVDPHSYLESLAALGAKHVWVEKILAPGEVLPEEWPVSGTTGYEFMNDVVRLLVYPGGESVLRQTYRRLLETVVPYRDEVVRCKRLVMETSLAGELTRLTNMLYRISEADYHTRDFTSTALRDALADIIAAFERYRTYLPFEREDAEEVLRHAVSEGKRLAQNTETSVHDFIFRCLSETFPVALEPTRQAFVGRFQQYTAPVAAKGVEDTAFYRYVPLAALNEVGGEPDHFTVELQAFHSRAHFREHRYPENLLATATHDHKRGEDTRMRLAVLSELAEEWQGTAERLDERAQRYWRESNRLGAPRISQRDAYLLFQHLLALWEGEQPKTLAPRLQAYMQKAIREAKEDSSWIDPNEGYEGAVAEFAHAIVHDEEVAAIVAPLAGDVARYGYFNSLSQQVLKLTTPGVPDIYQGSELLDLSLVDPDNRQPVDFGQRSTTLTQVSSAKDSWAKELAQWRESCDPRLKMLLLHRLLCFRREHPELLGGSYRAIDTDDPDSDEGAPTHLIAYSRESDQEQLLVIVPRYLAVLERSGGWRNKQLPIPEDLSGAGWQELLTLTSVEIDETVAIDSLPFLPAVLYRRKEAQTENIESSRGST
ncbi:MAG: malto-oligosyltrehalose synthase [Trueperaceae bacterium]